MPVMAVSVDMLRRVPLFQDMSARDLKKLTASFSDRPFQAGEKLTVQGHGGAGFFIIESGEATVTVDGEVRGTLGAGDYFGEIALIDEGTRTATVTASTDGQAYGLTSWVFRPLVQKDASIAWPLLQAMARRIRQLQQSQGVG